MKLRRDRMRIRKNETNEGEEERTKKTKKGEEERVKEKKAKERGGHNIVKGREVDKGKGYTKKGEGYKGC
ncbi:hypothetical protein M8J76_003018 [Diaphorina citri]|nr:hypothetical protein M8J76_003018 [Diaphorina citri]